MPMSRRKRTGSLQRSRSVDIASETAVWPAALIFCPPLPWPKGWRSQAAASNCSANMRPRIPCPVADEASGMRPTGVLPRRAMASRDREQQMLRHCLERKTETETRYIYDSYIHFFILTGRRARRAAHGADSSVDCVTWPGNLCLIPVERVHCWPVPSVWLATPPADD